MNSMIKVLPLMLLAFASLANATVGEVLYVIGTVTVEDPDSRDLKRGDRVDAGQEIVTGARGYAQVKLDDGSKLAIRPDSRFTIDEVEAPATAESPAIGEGKSLKASFSLKKGGFRTITGRIAQRNPSAYKVTTPSAVIRVRGTLYSMRHCSGDCGSGSQNGTYVGVSQGIVIVSTNAGDVEVGQYQYAYAANMNSSPRRLLAPPNSLSNSGTDGLGGEEGDEKRRRPGGGDDGQPPPPGSEFAGRFESVNLGEGMPRPDSELGTLFSPTDRLSAQTLTPNQDITVTGANGEPISITGGEIPVDLRAISFVRPQLLGTSVTAVELDDTTGALTAFETVANQVVVTYQIGTARTKNLGFDPVSGMGWGRWAEGTAEIDDGLNTTDVDLSDRSLHWVVAADEIIPVQQITGTASYTLVGNTDPTDNLGNVGVLGTANLTADFTNATVQSRLALGINDRVWNASGSGSISSNFFSGLYRSVTVDGVAGGSGSFAGNFTNFSTPIPNGAGMAYELVNGQTRVTGAAVFNRSGQ